MNSNNNNDEKSFVAIQCDGGKGDGHFQMFAIIDDGDEEAAARAIALHRLDFGTECKIRFIQEG